MGYGVTWVLTEDGDFDFEVGDIKWTSDVETVGQSLKNIFLTQYREDLLAPVYGFDIEALLGSDLLYREQLELLELLSREATFQDDRVVNIIELTKTLSNRVASLMIKIQLQNGEIITLNLNEVL